MVTKACDLAALTGETETTGSVVRYTLIIASFGACLPLLAAAQTDGGQIFVEAMDRSYVYVSTGDLAAFGGWQVNARDGFECPTCEVKPFSVEVANGEGNINCFVHLNDQAEEFRLCAFMRELDWSTMPLQSPHFSADSRLADSWLNAQQGLFAAPEGTGQKGQVFTWMTCPAEDKPRAQAVVVSDYSAALPETLPTHWIVMSGTEDAWFAEFDFPYCAALTS